MWQAWGKEKGKREGGRGERGRDACYIRTPFYSFTADAGVRKFLIGWAIMSNLLACILACISVRDKHDEGIKKMCSTGISFGRSKLLQSCSNFTLKPELKPTVTACLAGRDAQEVLYTGFVHTPSSDSKRLRFLPDICNADIQKTSFSAKTYTVLNGVLNGLQRESWSFGKNYPLSVLTIVYNSPLLSLFAVAIWPVTGQGFQNAKWPAFLYYQ